MKDHLTLLRHIMANITYNIVAIANNFMGMVINIILIMLLMQVFSLRLAIL